MTRTNLRSVTRHVVGRRIIVAGTAVTAAAALVMLAGCGSNSSSQHGPMPGTGAASSAATSASTGTFNDADVTFAQMMIPHHQQAVQMAELVDAQAAASAEVKQLAGQIKAAQGPEIQMMTGWLSAWGKPTTAPSATASGMPGMNMGGASASAMSGMGATPGMMSDADMAQLKAVHGKGFDKQFCTMMIAHHQGAIQMAKQEQSAGTNPDAKALAGRIISGQQAEIDTMNKILGQL